MIPNERSLVETMKGKPFAIVGVNTDGRESYAKWMLKLPVTWRSFDDGGSEGPICKRWSVGGFPTIYVLDHQGVIRFIDPPDHDLDSIVKKLIAASETGPESR